MGHKTITCPECEGTGMHRLRVNCRVCKGLKSIQIPESYIPCPICKSKGKVLKSSLIPGGCLVDCRKCKGIGWIAPDVFEKYG